MLEADGVTVRLGSIVALDGVSLSIQPGEVLAVVGRSGSGKSTLLHCLAGIPHTDERGGPVPGRAARPLVGAPARRMASTQRRRRIPVRRPGARTEPRRQRQAPAPAAKVSRAETARRTAEMMERLEIADISGRRPGEVSGGQQQRAAIARALVHRPAVVLADEPTGALDTVTGQLVLEALLLAARQQNSAVVLVTHEARLSSYCDREITLRDGAVVEPALR